MTEWLDELARKTKQKYDDQRISDQKYVIEEQQKHAAGKQFMQQFLAHLRNCVNDLNAKVGGDNILNTQQEGNKVTIQAHLTRQETKTVQISYLEPLFQINVSSPTSAIDDTFRLVLAGGSAMAEMPGSARAGQPIQFSAFQFVQMILSQLLD